MHPFQPWKRKLTEESGITLVEILIAITIMSVVTVTIIGYYFSAMEKSADQSRRVIAANLARLKAAELRKVFQDGSSFDDLNVFIEQQGLAAGTPGSVTLMSNASVTSAVNASSTPEEQYVKQLVTSGEVDFDPTSNPPINGTVYRYMIRLDNRDQGRNQELQSAMGSGQQPQRYLIATHITVYWTSAEVQSGDVPSGKFAADFQTYLVKRR